MAKAAFISLYDEAAYGLRLLSACLTKAGHQRVLIFLKGYENSRSLRGIRLYEDEKPWEGVSPTGNSIVYATAHDITDNEEEILIRLLNELKVDFVGMTVNTPLKWRANRISTLIKRHFPELPIVWGGFEPTINSEESLKHCDIVCRGEAEQTIIELAEAFDGNRMLESVSGLCFKLRDRIVKSDLSPLCEDLNELPFPDYDIEGTFYIGGGKLTERPQFLYPVPDWYSTISGRGCLFRCSYCCESFLREMYKSTNFLRRRTPQNVIAELEQIKEKRCIGHVIFNDTVFSYEIDWLKEFVPLYKTKIGLPFTANVFPSQNFKERLELLKDAGMSSTCLAMQSGSSSICRLYNRFFDRKLFIEAAQTLSSAHMTFYTDVITYNPAETKDDLEHTLAVLLELPQPYGLCVNKLYLLPGTKISEKLANINVNGEQQRMFKYYSSLFWLASHFKCSRYLIVYIKRLKIFGRYPELMKPILFISSKLGSFKRVLLQVDKLRHSNRLNISIVKHHLWQVFRRYLRRALRLSTMGWIRGRIEVSEKVTNGRKQQELYDNEAAM